MSPRCSSVLGSLGIFVAAMNVSAAQFHAYFGTYTGTKSEGIYVAKFDAETGKAEEPKLAAKATSPSFLAVHPDGRHLYAVNETDRWRDQSGGYVTAYAIDVATGQLKELNQQSTGGGAPCHVIVDAVGKHVLAANYMGGNVAVLPLNPSGELLPHSALVQHKGSSVNPNRQKQPHAHSINLSPDGRFALAADLGTDRIYVSAFDVAKGSLAAQSEMALPPGSGPRHLAFSPDGKFVFVINELLSTLASFSWDAAKGTLTAVDSQPTLPKDFSGSSTTAEVRVHPNGRFVYGSNRGHDSIAVFAVDEAGKLRLVEHVATGGRTPRNFNFDPTGKFLWVANQGSDSVVLFRVDAATGKLATTGQSLSVGSPVCIRFVAVR